MAIEKMRTSTFTSRSRILTLGLAGLLPLVLLLGCPKKEEAKKEEPKKEEPKKEDPKKEEPKAGDAKAEPKADGSGMEQGQSDPACVGPLADAPAATFEVAGRKFERKGAVLTETSKDADDEFTIGHITDIKDYTPENKANLEIILGWFKTEKVDAVAVTGDIGESQGSIESVLDLVAGLDVPVFAIIGNRECKDHFNLALEAVAKKKPHVINMNHVRVFNGDDASLVSLPGYFNRTYLHCADGCQYYAQDVAALEGVAAKATGPVKVLVSHGPPKMEGDKALDRIHEEANVGDPELAKLMAEKKLFQFGLFGNIQEAGGHATDLSGKNVIAEGTFSDNLYLNSGPMDSVRWQMLDGTESLGMAGIMKIKGKQASHKVRRIRAGEAKVEKSE
jgi:Icc-related predicted phosphoesterase